MVSSMRKSSLPPFTVVTQGSGLSYDDQILLDNLEYAIRVGGPATPRFLAQDGNVNGLARALSIGLTKVTSSEVRLRAGKLLTTLVEYVISHGNEAFFSEFINGLGDKLFEPFLFYFKSEPREVSTTYLNAVGQAMGHRNLTDIISQKEMTLLLDAQRIRYVKCMSSLLETVTSEAIATSNSDGENGTSVSAPVITANTTGSMGYIPTVSGINPGMPDVTSVGDEQLNTVLAGLSAFLTRDENRWAFCGGALAKGTGGDEEDKASLSKAVDYLAGLVQKDVGLPVQVHYQAIFCLWLLSFAGQHDPTSAMAERVSKAMDEASVPRRLASVLREASAEKVIRISLSTLRNLMKMSTLLRKEMVAAGLVGALETLCLRRWNDDDIRDDLGVLADALEKEHASMSTFDVYRAEILSGALDWTPPHRDETFWQQNVERLESNNLEVLRCIVRVLNESTDKTVLSVACHDLAQFVKHHPRGRQIAQSLGVKGRLMELMVTGDGDVRRYALNGVQVLMITHWNLMQRTA